MPVWMVSNTRRPDRVSWDRGPSFASEKGSICRILDRAPFTASTGLFTAERIPSVKVSIILTPDCLNRPTAPSTTPRTFARPWLHSSLMPFSFPPVNVFRKSKPAV